MQTLSVEQIAQILNVSERTAYRYKAKGETFVLNKISQVQNKLTSLNKTHIQNTDKPTDSTDKLVTIDTDKLTDVMTKLTDKIAELSVRIDSLEKALKVTVFRESLGAESDKITDNSTAKTDKTTDNFTDKLVTIDTDNCQFKGGGDYRGV